MLGGLRDITQELSRATNLDDALDVVVHRVKHRLAVDVCSVYLLEPPGNGCILMATDGLDPRAVGRIQFHAREGLVGMVVESGQLLSLANAHLHPRFRFLPEYGEQAYHAFLGVPITCYGLVRGILVVRQANDRSFSTAEEAFLLAIASALAGLVGPAMLAPARRHRRDGPLVLTGIKAAPGAGLGLAILPAAAAELDDVSHRQTDDPEGEEAAFRQAVKAVQIDLRASGERMTRVLTSETHAMFRVYAALLDDKEMFVDVIQRIRQGEWAPSALRAAIARHSALFDKMEDPYLRARGEDIRGLGRRVLLHLRSPTPASRRYPDKCVLVGEEISVARIADVPIEQLAGLVCTRGSPSSHAAILARTLRIPAVVNVANVSLAQMEGRELFVDGHQGRVFVEPPKAVRAELEQLAARDAILDAKLATLKHMPAETPDGVRVSLHANVGLVSDIPGAENSGAEGIGLFRTEFTFMVRDSFPDEDDQAEIYGSVLAAFAPRPVTMRTLDVGGEKPLPYFPVSEDNPLLGWRGTRLMLDNPGIFLTQLRAMIRAHAKHGNLRLLLPMIGGCSEVEAVRALIERALAEVLHAGRPASMPPIGIMIEVPAAIYQIAALAKRVDFFSLGTNDLTQYLLAVDRNNPRITDRYDCLHPAVLAAIDHAIREARSAGTSLSVCGEMAGEPASAVLLMGMGVDSFSMAPPNLPRVKRALRTFTRHQATELACAALAAERAEDVHQILADACAQAGVD